MKSTIPGKKYYKEVSIVLYNFYQFFDSVENAELFAEDMVHIKPIIDAATVWLENDIKAIERKYMVSEVDKKILDSYIEDANNVVNELFEKIML